VYCFPTLNFMPFEIRSNPPCYRDMEFLPGWMVARNSELFRGIVSGSFFMLVSFWKHGFSVRL